MSTKLLYSMTDENPDLQKQIGCMNGFFQLFDSRRFLPRRLSKGSHKRLPPPAQSSNHGMDANNALQKDKHKSLKRVVKEKQRISTESSRTSFSSSCSSSFSSLDCNKAAQLETSSFSQTMNQQNASLQSSQHSLDIRDVVKNSMHREARALSVKTATKGEAVGRGLKHIDSPRPVQPPKSAKTRVSGLNESFRVLGRPQDATWNSIEENDLKIKDAPRFSYDGRESRKSAIKLKELPRLSLDSKAGSIRGTTSEIKSNNILRDLQRGCGKSKKNINAQQELESCKQPSTVVAKLMGLEPPDFMSINESSIRPIKTCRDELFDPFSRTPSRTDKNKQNRISGSPMTSQSISPQLKNADLVKKRTPSSRFPIEPAPWMQPDVTPASQITTFRCREAPPKSSNSSPSVYSEIEKRLTELEFKKSGKDLRALKQILEAMQKTKVMLETQKEDWASNFVSESGNNSSLGGSVKLQNPRNLQGNSTNSVTNKGTNSPKGIKSPIVIMKPANFIKKASNPASSEIPTDGLAGICKQQTADYAERRKESVDKRMTKNPTPRNNHLKDPSSQPVNSVEKNTSTRAFRSTQTSKMPKHIAGKNTTNSIRGSGTVSPRLQQQKLGLEMQSHPTTPQSDLSRTRRQSSRQPTESGSPGKKFQPKSPNLQPSHYQPNEAYSNMRDLSYQGDAVSLQSESNSSLVSHSDTEVTSTNRSSIRGISLEQDDHKQKNPAARLSEDRLMETPAISTLEQPSPISVLDSTFYNDDLPSPVKKISNAFNDDETQDDDEAAWKSLELNHLTNGTKPSLDFENDQKILENIQHLVRDLGQMNSTHEESIDENIASLGENTNLDHRYISEILLASGFLTGIGSGSKTGHPINPNLFLALEQTKASISFSDDEFISEKVFQSKPNDKIRRKLIFDTVHEILARKLELEGSSKQRQNKVAGRRIGSQQQLLKELCSDIDQIQANNSHCSLDDEDDWLRGILREDFMHRSMDWANYQSEISKVVLDVERLIFKDLISEAVGSVAVGERTWPDRHCRQLFLK